MHLEHLGSNTDVWKNTWFPKLAMQRAAGNLQNSLNRPKDISFVIDQLVRLNQQPGRFYHRLDLKHIGATGHSFGAYSVLAIAGEVFPLGFGRQTTFADSRVIAVIPMSAPVPKKAVNYSRAFGSISIPCLHMTGTLDDSLINDTKSAQRRIPYDYARHSDQYLLTFNGGDHMVFSGRGTNQPSRQTDALFQDYIKMSSLAFWNAYLKNDASAKQWLSQDGFKQALGKWGTWEVKKY